MKIIKAPGTCVLCGATDNLWIEQPGSVAFVCKGCRPEHPPVAVGGGFPGTVMWSYFTDPELNDAVNPPEVRAQMDQANAAYREKVLADQRKMRQDTITVGQLIHELKRFDSSTPVLMAKYPTRLFSLDDIHDVDFHGPAITIGDEDLW